METRSKAKAKVKAKAKKPLTLEDSESSTVEAEQEEEILETPEELEAMRKQYEAEQIKARKTFRKTGYTIDDYQAQMGKFKTIEDHEDYLRRFIGKVGSTEYVIRCRSKDTGFGYIVVPAEALRNKYLSTYVMLKEKQKNLKQDKPFKYNPYEKSIQNGAFAVKLAYFSKAEIVTDIEDQLQLYLPPVYPDNENYEEQKQHVEAFIDFYAHNRMVYDKPFYEELTAHAYRFRNIPNKQRIVKIFLHYDRFGGAGKSLLTHLLDTLYPKFAAVGAQAELLDSGFNSWIMNTLFANFEELPESTYENKKFETFIKQVTTGKAMKSQKYKDTVQDEYQCLVTMNSNNPDLYGLIGADDAAVSRMVILVFNPKPSPEVWNEFKTKIGLLGQETPEEINMQRFGATFYRYLREDYVNPYYPDMSKWEPERYDGPEKDVILRKLTIESNKIPVKYILKLEEMDEDDQKILGNSKSKKKEREAVMCDLDEYWKILQTRTIGGADCWFINNQSLEKSFDEFKKYNKDAQKYQSNSIKKFLVRRVHWKGTEGAKEGTTKSYKIGNQEGLYISKAEFAKWTGETKKDEEEDKDERGTGLTTEQKTARKILMNSYWQDIEHDGLSGKFLTREQYEELMMLAGIEEESEEEQKEQGATPSEAPPAQSSMATDSDDDATEKEDDDSDL